MGSSTVVPDQGLVNSLSAAGVNVHLGYIPRIDHYYKAADCYIFTTINSNYSIQLPLSVVEALACNLPVISTRYEALPSFFPENKPSLTYVSTFDNLEKIIIEVLNEKSKNDERYDQKIIRSFEWKSIAERLHRFYQEILGPSYEQ